MKLALAFTSKNRVELTKQTFPVVRDGKHALFWFDGSTEANALAYWDQYHGICTGGAGGVRGGADAAIVCALSGMLNDAAEYTHIGLLENDVLLDSDWLEPTLALFGKGAKDGLAVGAVSARSYRDRVLVARDGYAVMHNVGAGHVVFTRQAAKIVLKNYRTGFTAENWKLFALLSGLDIRTSWCFAGQEHAITGDWSWDTVLANHGLATLALTPAKATMIGQDLAAQGLELIDGEIEDKRNEEAFDRFCTNTRLIRERKLRMNVFDRFQERQGQTIYYPHQLPMIGGQFGGKWKFKWAQGFGPFAYQAGEEGASLAVPAYGSCSFLVSGGNHENGANVEIIDLASGFRAAPQLAPDTGIVAPTEINVPGTNSYRTVTVGLSAGAMFYGMVSPHRQPEFVERSFCYADLPEVAE